MVCMLIDHIAAVVLLRVLISNGLLYAMANESLEAVFMEQYGLLYTLYELMRLIGRLGFPIFCFLLIEGFLHTKNVWKYAGRLFLFALISEVPFDLACRGFVYTLDYQNVFFTLLLGLFCILFLKKAEDKFAQNKVVELICDVAIILLFAVAAYLLKTDYDMWGILTIAVMYMFRRNRIAQMAGGSCVLCFADMTELASFATIPFIYLYNGKRGLNLKYVFYAFYPVHLLILYLITYLMGNADVFQMVIWG